MHSFGESPSVAVESRLSQILEDSPLPKYCLSAKACQGILNRANKRGKELPPELEAALENQAGCEVAEPIAVDVYNQTIEGKIAPTVTAAAGGTNTSGPKVMTAGFKAGQSTGGIGYEEEMCPTMQANPNALEPTVLCAGFKAGNGAQARSIGYQEEVAPTLPSEAGGNSVPAIVRANEEFDWL